MFYLDIPLAETLRRHATRPQAAELGEADLRAWYLPHDLLGVAGEYVIGPDWSCERSVSFVHAAAGLPSAGPDE